jgi:hypothetical protein
MHSIMTSIDCNINSSIKELKKIPRPHKGSLDNIRKGFLMSNKRVTHTRPHFSEGTIEASAGLHSFLDDILKHLWVQGPGKVVLGACFENWAEAVVCGVS